MVETEHCDRGHNVQWAGGCNVTWKLKVKNDRASATGTARSGALFTGPAQHIMGYLRGLGLGSSGRKDKRSLAGRVENSLTAGFTCVIWVTHLFLSAVKNETHNNFLAFCIVAV